MFIVLTDFDDGTPVLVSVNNIKYLKRGDLGDRTEINLGSDGCGGEFYLEVVETIGNIKAMLENRGLLII